VSIAVAKGVTAHEYLMPVHRAAYAHACHGGYILCGGQAMRHPKGIGILDHRLAQHVLGAFLHCGGFGHQVLAGRHSPGGAVRATQWLSSTCGLPRVRVPVLSNAIERKRPASQGAAHL